MFREENGELRIVPAGTFVYRLSVERAKSASFYTPEVLTKTMVKYTLKPILERLQSGEMSASELLDMKILEPAMGAAAFHNEAINQIAEAYLTARQEELGKRVKPDEYREELQKVKAYIALHNVYGVDLNPTAVERQTVLWLNVIHKDMETPFFAHRLGVGNAVVGAWLRGYKEADYRKQPGVKGSGAKWWERAPDVHRWEQWHQAARRRRLPLSLPDAGMGSAADHKDMKTRFPEESKRVREWRKAFVAPLDATESRWVQALSQTVDGLLAEHANEQKRMLAQTGNSIALFGMEAPELGLNSYEEKERLANQRMREHAPYYKLKLIMDYWCALWYWSPQDARDAGSPYVVDGCGAHLGNGVDGNRGRRTVGARCHGSRGTVHGPVWQFALELTRKASSPYRFFHPQLEFIEVFAERGGFDVVVGNPPWVVTEFDEEGSCGYFSGGVSAKTGAPQTRKKVKSLIQSSAKLEGEYYEELL